VVVGVRLLHARDTAFLSLFQHWLRRDDLEYCFENVLESQDTPESVLLKQGDTIVVRTSKLLFALYRALYLLQIPYRLCRNWAASFSSLVALVLFLL
jgi:hypothetical protein